MSNKIKIIYVDDEFINTELFKIIFSEKYNVIIGESGFDGLTLLSENQDVKIVISDMKMPGMNGVEFIKKAKEKFPDTNYYILTGFDINDEISQAIEDKLIISCFHKPFNETEVEKAIQEALDK